jgi:VIT1/CCC1 family predicted Fe2+/Mn2+ transporter/rubrerythrin
MGPFGPFAVRPADGDFHAEGVGAMPSAARRKIVDAMRSNWRDEVRGARTYRALAAAEPDPRRRDILIRLAEAEERHARMWEQHMREVGETPPDAATVEAEPAAGGDPEARAALLHRLEADEGRDAEKYRQLLGLLPTGPLRRAVESMAADELGHAESLGHLTAGGGDATQAAAATPARPIVETGETTSVATPDGSASPHRRGIDPRAALSEMLGRERWHVHGATGWMGDAIYGANDGLGAIFGIVAGVAGYTGGGSHLVVVSGLAGMLASALSMGSGAYLATKAEGEVHAAEVGRERRELEESPSEEQEELALFYQLKGLSEAEAKAVVAQLARRPEAMLRSLAQEELGINIEEEPNPLLAASSSAIATAIGAIIPVIPFFFLSGTAAILVAAAVSLIAHFMVGALKTLVTSRSWIESGLEMTIVGAIEGAITYGLGVLLSGV